MIEFMLIALPRCGTTWASNWLTTESSLCLHDPLYTLHYSELDRVESLSGRDVGISCTGIWRFPKWVNAHSARKVVLHRPLAEINASMEAIGLPALTRADEDALNKISGLHLDYRALFHPAQARHIYHYLIKRRFDAERHAALVQIEMQPHFSGLKVGAEVTRRLMAEIVAAAS